MSSCTISHLFQNGVITKQLQTHRLLPKLLFIIIFEIYSSFYLSNNPKLYIVPKLSTLAIATTCPNLGTSKREHEVSLTWSRVLCMNELLTLGYNKSPKKKSPCEIYFTILNWQCNVIPLV
jgi:hypothetical protein